MLESSRLIEVADTDVEICSCQEVSCRCCESIQKDEYDIRLEGENKECELRTAHCHKV
jgi:hypothetical protein